MTRRKKKFDNKRVKEILPYAVAGILTIGLVAVGSIDKNTAGASLNFESIANTGYNISVDQISEYYVVASLSDAVGLATAQDLAGNYVTVKSMYESGVASSGKLEKPNITNIAVSRGVIERVVAEGESMASIAAEYGVTTDQIRWSNGKATTDVEPGELLHIPSVPGIVYIAQSGDTAESIAGKYGSTAAEIIALNDLEVSGVSEGMRIIIKGGELPEEERPEYVPPAPVITYNYTYYGLTSNRDVIARYGVGFDYANVYNDAGENINPMYGGQCTWYAWWWRYNYGAAYGVSALPTGMLGNANAWASVLGPYGYGLTVDGNPSPGAIFQDASGYTGHVGIVLEVLSDGRIHTTEMNYMGSYVVTDAYMSYDTWRYLNFIH